MPASRVNQASRFVDANLSTLIDQGVPADLAKKTTDILDAQNRGELPCPLEGEELAIVRQAWRCMGVKNAD